MTRFYAEQYLPRGSADSQTVVVDNDATRGDGVLCVVDPQGSLSINQAVELAELIARRLNDDKFVPEYE